MKPIEVDLLEPKLIRARRGLPKCQVAAAFGIVPCRLSEIDRGRQPLTKGHEYIRKVIGVEGDVSKAEE